MEGIWRMSGGCPEGVRRVSEICLEGDWKVFGSSLEGFLKVPERCLVVSGRCMQVCKYANMHVCKYTNAQLCKTARVGLNKVFDWSMQSFKSASMQV